VALSRLTSAQTAAINTLVASRRLERVAPDPVRAASFLAQASDAIADVGNLTRPQNAYNLAYDACHDVGEAMLAAYGFRTKGGAGQHDALIAFLRAVLDTPPGDAAAQRLDRLRRARNASRYEARTPGAGQARVASDTAIDLFAAASARGVGT